MKNYCEITAHFIDNNCKFHSNLLNFRPAHGHHTGRSRINLLAQNQNAQVAMYLYLAYVYKIRKKIYLVLNVSNSEKSNIS